MDNPSEMDKYCWQNYTPILGKEILRFPSIYWIVELMALGAMLPKKIFAHPWLLFGTDKMSKSKGNVIYADDLVTRFGVDATRYYMLSEMPFAADGSISYEAVIERYNTDLANTIGNLVNRTVAMVNKYFGGYVDAPHDKTELDLELEAKALEAAKNLSAHFEAFRFADACADVLALARRANKYIDETEPWALAKTEEGKSRLVTVLYELIETIRFIGIMIRPIMPETSEKILAQINTDLDGLDTLCAFGGYAAGTKVGEAVPLFARIDSKKIMDELKAEMDAVKAKIEEENAKGGEPKAEVKPLADEIAIDEFAKVELRAAKVLECEKLEKSQKLLKLKLDDGMGTRQVVSGIAKWYNSEDLIGKTVVVVANLKPAKLCGEESQGMIVCAEMPDGSAKVAFLDGSVPPGAKLR